MNALVSAFVATATLGIALAAPESDFAVPVIGYLYEAAPGMVRPITGTPGAATVGAGHALGEFRNVLLSGDGSFALASASEADALQFLRFTTSSDIEASGIENVPSAFDIGALSPAGTSAILYAAACDCVRVVSGLRSEPKLIRTLYLPQDSDLRAIAVDDRAHVAAVSVRIDGAGKVLLFTSGSDTVAAELGLWAEALALDGPGERLLILETEPRKAQLVSNLGESPVLTEILSEREGLASPVAAAFLSGSTVVIADAKAGIFLWNAAERTTTRIDCPCRPSTVDPTATTGVYRVSSFERGAVWLLDTAAEVPRTFFVPAPHAEASK